MGAVRKGRVIVAGHICLDVIPDLSASRELRFVPGTMSGIGPVTVSTGGSVPNTGLSLYRLGAEVSLLAKIGDDPFGKMVRDSIARADKKLAEGLLVSPGEHTSCTIILSPPGEDRMFLHYSGANASFSSDDLPENLPEADIFHFGYPQVMRRMYQNGGEEMRRMFDRAKNAGLTTSLDTSYPDLSSEAGEADWQGIFENTLPAVDVFLPSVEEILVMLEPEYRKLAARDPTRLARAPVEDIRRLGEKLLGMGAAIVGIKAGGRGMYLRTSSEGRLKSANLPVDLLAWADREMWSSAFEATVVGTVGAGDAAVAGFLFGLLNGMQPERAITAACAAGASAVEAADATSGVRCWRDIESRIVAGWQRDEGQPDQGWSASKYPGVWSGPRDQR